jgi:hypothetical protein
MISHRCNSKYQFPILLLPCYRIIVVEGSLIPALDCPDIIIPNINTPISLCQDYE